LTAIGEVLNYAFDERNGKPAWDDLFRRAYEAIAPGGLLMFDIASCDQGESGTRRSFAEGVDWAVLVEVDVEQKRGELTRRITSFRQVGDLYRRHSETHRLMLMDSDEIEQSLRSVGFQVERLEGYGTDALPTGRIGFLGRKPACDAG
jgi:hypothetical protein